MPLRARRARWEGRDVSRVAEDRGPPLEIWPPENKRHGDPPAVTLAGGATPRWSSTNPRRPHLEKAIHDDTDPSTAPGRLSAIQSMSTPWKATAIVSCLVCVALLGA
jgi:hypothetical protein